MATLSGGEGSAEGGEARTVALAEEFGAQLRRMGGAGDEDHAVALDGSARADVAGCGGDASAGLAA